jgi:hypothetical protein
MNPLYIDPGTGSLLFSIVIGLVTMLYFVGKAALIKIKFLISGGKLQNSTNKESLIIYSEGKKYWNVFLPILEALEQKEIKALFYTSSEDDEVFNKNYKHITSEYIGEGNKAYTRLNFLEADVCLMTTPGLDVYQLKRSKGVKHYSHILHAVDDATSYRLFGLDYFDSVLLSGEYQKKHVRELEKQRNIKEKELVVVGCPYLDVLQEKIKTLQLNEKSEFTVLVAPSWGENGILSKYGTTLLDPLVNTHFNLIVRPHPQSKLSEKKVLDDLQNRYKDRVGWDFAPDNLSTLAKSDVMISDFSGVVFDYSFLFDRPFLYVNSEFDDRPYDSYDIDEKAWKFQILPKIGLELKVEDFKNIETIINNIIDNKSFSENRLEAKEIAWQNRGTSGENVVKFLETIIYSSNK